jgi:hypothetical protein
MPTTNNRINDFVSLFNAFWYRDFPLSEVYKPLSNRAGWTAHIGSVVKSSADLLGLFTYFESGTRTDAVIRDNKERDIAHLEWEWWQPFTDKVNEIKKLHLERKKAEFSVFFSYSRRNNHEENLRSILKQWRKNSELLIVFLVTFDVRKGRRWFYDLETYLVQNEKMKKIRSQPALPWDVKGTRWESYKQLEEVSK